MKGLLRDNFYAAYANEKIFFAVIFVVGIVVAAVSPDGSAFIRNYMLICQVGFSYVALDSLGKDSTCRWEKYKLTVPVTRADIVRSCYVGHLAWLAAGTLFAGVSSTVSILLHGYPFDRGTDLVLAYTLGMSISFFMGAVFFPLFYLYGFERKEAFLFISIFSAFGAAAGLAALLNYLFGRKMSSSEIVLSAFIILACAAAAFGLSLMLTVRIFSKKEY